MSAPLNVGGEWVKQEIQGVMTKKQLAEFMRRANAIHERGLRRGHALVIDTLRQLENLRREYEVKRFHAFAKKARRK